jgi:site-specific DNA-cytosine methylase
MKNKVINFAKRINPHRRLRSSWVAHTNEQKQHEPIIYDCGIFAIERLRRKSETVTENLQILQELEDLYNN